MTALVGGIGLFGGVILFALLRLCGKKKEPSARFLLDFACSFLLPAACYAVAAAVSGGNVKSYFAICFAFGFVSTLLFFPSKSSKNRKKSNTHCKK